MISSKEAESMDYLTYKRAFWSRMLAWWQTYSADHPERKAFVDTRIAFAEARVAMWARA